ncbi:T9SS type A sorting domain-containing protein [bacterium]|nr:T9SS type A sorting domain-containing protein [bacterium]
MRRRAWSLSTFIVLLALLIAIPAAARNPIKNAFLDAYPAADNTVLTDVPSSSGHCGACHFDFDGGGARNPYGLAIEIAINGGLSNLQAVLAVENEDSDNDGFSNLIEITDTVNFGNTPTFPGLTSGNVNNAHNVNLAELLDFLTPSGGSDITPPSVLVVGPNGGESYGATTTQSVSWTATDASGIASVDLYLSDESGEGYKPVAKGLSNSGSYDWFVQNRPGLNNRLKVVARDGAGNYGDDESDADFTIDPLVGGVVPTTMRDFDLPGTQPFDGAILEDPSTTCITCHGGYDETAEPWHTWQGSMMAHAQRDPHFLATMVIAEQDAPASGDLCLRCHTPGGWQEGRSFDTSGGMITAVDRQGVQCDFCHRMVDPVYVEGVNPIEDLPILDELDDLPPGHFNGMFINDPAPVKRGPYPDVDASHQFLDSAFHRTSLLCGTCHDVSNPAFELGSNPNEYVPGNFDEEHPDADLRNMFPVERTYSEWTQSEYASTGVYAPQFAGNKPDGIVSSCLDCHMRDGSGRGADSGPVRSDLGMHDLTGGNYWVPDIIETFFPGETDAAALADGKQRVIDLLQLSATLELIDTSSGAPSLQVKVTNETGHKLPSGYPEGRRMWINVKAYDESMALIYESAAYDFDTADLSHDEDAKIYEIKPGTSYRLANLLGGEPGPSFHFVLNDTIWSDNRIPPRGFTNANFQAVQSPVVNYSYADGQYWDETDYALPGNASSAQVTLYYQSTSKEYVEFLRDGNTTNTLGQELYDAWLAQGMAAPVAMATASIDLVLTDGPGEAPAYRNHLGQNLPNPFNPNTMIAFGMAKAGRVRVTIFDSSGRQVIVLLDEHRNVGEYELQWNGRDDSGRVISSGLYLYQLDVPGYTATRKMLMLK